MGVSGITRPGSENVVLDGHVLRAETARRRMPRIRRPPQPPRFKVGKVPLGAAVAASTGPE